MLDVIIPLIIGIAIGAIGVCIWTLSVVQKKRENAAVENKTDPEDWPEVEVPDDY